MTTDKCILHDPREFRLLCVINININIKYDYNARLIYCVIL